LKLSYRNTGVLFAFAVAAIVCCSLLFFKSIQKTSANYFWVNHTNEVLIKIEETFSSLISAETGVRGYQVTKDKNFLNSFEEHHQNVVSGLQYIAELTKDNPTQQEKLKQLQKTIEHRFELFHIVIRSEDQNVIIQLAKEGQVLTEEARSLFAELALEEQQLMSTRKENLGSSQSFLVKITGLVIVGALIVLCLLFYQMLMEIRTRKKAENELVEKEKIIEKIKEFEFLADSIPQIIWTADSKGNLDYYNKNWFDYTGKSFEQTKDWLWQSILHPDDVQNCVETWKKSLRTGEDYEVEYRLKNGSTGEYEWHLDRAIPMRNAQGEIVKWFGTCTNIHDQKIGEEQLKSANEQLASLYEAIFQSSNYSIISTNKEGIITSFNKASEEQLGYKPEEVIGKKSPGIFHDPQEVGERAIELSRELGIQIDPGVGVVEAKARLGMKNEAEWTHIRKDGTSYPVRLSITTLKDTMGEINGFMGIAIDISEERKMKELALEKENQLKAFIKHTPAAVAMYDEHLHILIVSDLYLKEFGKTKEEVLGKKHQDTYSHNGLEEKLFRALNGEIVQETDSKLRLNLEKKEEWYHTEIHPWYKYDGSIGGVILMLQNISSRIKTLQELRQKSQMLSAFMENMSVRLYRFDQYGNILEAIGKGWHEIGINPVELVGKNAYQLYPERKALIDAALECRESYEMNINYDVNGLPRYFENYIFKDDESSNPKGIIGFAMDVTDKMIREIEIKENEERFRSLLESAPDAMIIVNEKGGIDLINTQTKKMFYYEETELIGLQVDQLFPSNFSEHLDYQRRIAEASLETHAPVAFELYAKRKDGSEFPAEIILSPIQTKKALLVSASVRDATERHLFQRQLEEAKTVAENANMIKSRFLANMSHEIRTPLNAIIGFADVLAKQEITKKQKDEYLGYINSSGNLLLKLIGDVLDISKIEEGKLELLLESFSFKEVISSSILPYKFPANERGLDFALEFSEDIPDYLIGDSNRIKQVIINLIGNALKFTKEGKITVDISTAIPKNERDEVRIRIAVSDTGMGISQEQHKTVFESFTQADNSIVRKFGGTGLGLAIVKQLVSMMGGEIQVISPIDPKPKIGGNGTTFWFSIPMKVDTTRVKPSSITQDGEKKFNNLDSIKLLVVEDNLLNQRLAKLILTNIGCLVHFANNGKEAVDILESGNEFSIIFMDVQMPVMDGYEATRKIRNELGLKLPIIGLTANVFKEDIDNCLSSGMNDYLSKPYNENQMYDIIKKWL
jgi:PAS domain S-box-containing protein